MAVVFRPRRLARRAAAVAATAVLAVVTAGPAHGAPRFPDVVALPDGWRPEGLVTGRGTSVYVGSLADGAIWRGDLRTGTGSVLVPGSAGQMAVGLELDSRNRIWVAGGATGLVRVFDAATGQLLASYTVAGAGSFLNDVALTRDAAYVTDSNLGQLVRIPLGRNGSLPDPSAVVTIALGGEFVPGGSPNANGIETTTNGKALLVVNTVTGVLYRVDPATGAADAVELAGGTLLRGDGIVRQGRTLFVVQNFLNQIAVVRLDPDGRSGTIVDVLADSDLDIPTTADVAHGAVYTVNARFSTPPGPDVGYDIVRVAR